MELIIDELRSASQNNPVTTQHTTTELDETAVMAERLRDAWLAQSPRLAVWVFKTLLNRSDVYGAYRSLNKRNTRSKSYTAPVKERRVPGALTLGRLEQHFTGHDHGHLIGIHSIGQDNTCRWLAIDIDNHGDDESKNYLNFEAALHWFKKAEEFHRSPILMDSNGNGGYHLLLVFDKPIDSEMVHSFGKHLISDWKKLGLNSAPEVFPKQKCLSDRVKFGNWLRLPGRHHTRDHWTRVFSGGSWLSAAETPRFLTSVRGSDTSPLTNWWENNKQTFLASKQQTQDSAIPTSTCFQSPKRATSLYGLANKTVDFINGDFKDKQNWNCNLFKAACDLAGNGYSDEEALPILLRGASPNTPADEEMAKRTIESAFSEPRSPARQKAVAQSPRSWISRGIVVTRTDRGEKLGGGQNE